MTRMKIEGVTLRINDVWEKENNGKQLYFDLNKIWKADIPKNLSYEDLETEMRFKVLMTRDKDYSGEMKNELIDVCEKILELQRQEGTRSKGRTCEQIADMTNIPEYYVRNYLSEKHKMKRNISEEERRKKDTTAAMHSVCRQMKYLAGDLEDLDLNNESIDYALLFARTNELILVLKKLLLLRLDHEF